MDNTYHPNEPLWVTNIRTKVADQFQLRLDEGTYNPIRSRPVGQQRFVSDSKQRNAAYWEIGVPFVQESTAMFHAAPIYHFLNEQRVEVQSNCGAWSDEDMYGNRRNAVGARFILWFELSEVKG